MNISQTVISNILLIESVRCIFIRENNPPRTICKINILSILFSTLPKSKNSVLDKSAGNNETDFPLRRLVILAAFPSLPVYFIGSTFFRSIPDAPSPRAITCRQPHISFETEGSLAACRSCNRLHPFLLPLPRNLFLSPLVQGEMFFNIVHSPLR